MFRWKKVQFFWLTVWWRYLVNMYVVCGRGMYGVICRLKYVEMLQKGAIWIHLFTFTADDIVSETNNFIGN